MKTLTIQPVMRVRPCSTNPDLWFSDNRAERELAAHICLTHCPVLDRCHEITAHVRVPGTVQAGQLQTEDGPAVRQPLVNYKHCTQCHGRPPATAPTSRWDDCGQPKAYRRHIRGGEKPCQPCRAGRRAAERERGDRRREEARQRAGTAHRPCGSVHGLKRHREAGEEPCDVCRAAQRAASEKGTQALLDAAAIVRHVGRVRELVGRGLPDEEIAAQLSLSKRQIQRIRKANGIPRGGSSVGTVQREAA